MAIVFVSPTKKRSIVVWIIAAVLVLVILLIAAIIFLPELRKRLDVAEPESVITIPEVIINFPAIDADRVKNLEPFLTVESVEVEGRLDPFTSYYQAPKASGGRR